MTNQAPAQLLSHLRGGSAPFVLRRVDREPALADAAVHREAFERDTELYALLGLAPEAHPAQRARALFYLLWATREGCDLRQRDLFVRATAALLASLPADDVLTVFLALRRVRANHKHTTRAIVRYILEHPCLPSLAALRRPSVVDCLEHAVGTSTMRACARMLGAGPVDERYLRSKLLRFLEDDAGARAVIPYLYGYASTPGASEPYALAHVRFAGLLDSEGDEPKTVTPTNRGDLAAALYHTYRGGPTPELLAAAAETADRLAPALPRFDGTVALVLDVSASTRGYGEREWACVSQAVAFRMILERCCERLLVFQAGAFGDLEPPVPAGPTDLAEPLLAALAEGPDLVVVVTDGYENAAGGDLARVVEALPRAGIHTPVAICHSKFSAADDLSLRRPAPALPEVAFWHQDDFENVLLSLFAMVAGEAGRDAVRGALSQRLDRLGKETGTWIASN
jgi:hypothetical protein